MIELHNFPCHSPPLHPKDEFGNHDGTATKAESESSAPDSTSRLDISSHDIHALFSPQTWVGMATSTDEAYSVANVLQRGGNQRYVVAWSLPVDGDLTRPSLATRLLADP
ncbi:hypothetical protein MKZ38_008535 [Zalerion maritima]|uniref:Uncharacterized protein n=1 Tax=Zalerion maritima TaxID=339359 RepID=A0AAD5WTA9_9PEZI|nr:hypothetical protein MKZ38_008535 [Zalerion maritima]